MIFGKKRSRVFESGLKVKRKIKHTPIQIVVCVLFAIYSAIILFPFVYAILISLETTFEFENTAFPMPKVMQFKNYVTAWKSLKSDAGSGVPEMFINSLWYAGGGTIIGLACGIMTAYAVARYKFPGRQFVYYFVLITMMIPVIGSMPSNLKMIVALKAYNSPLYVVIASIGTGAGFLVFYATFKGIDWGYAEAAFIDGAGHFTVFFKIMLPQIIAPALAIGLSEFIAAWSNAEVPLVYFPRLPTLASGLLEYEKVAKKDQTYPVYFAGLITCMIPTVALFAVFQKYFLDIQIGGGLKG